MTPILGRTHEGVAAHVAEPRVGGPVEALDEEHGVPVDVDDAVRRHLDTCGGGDVEGRRLPADDVPPVARVRELREVVAGPVPDRDLRAAAAEPTRPGGEELVRCAARVGVGRGEPCRPAQAWQLVDRGDGGAASDVAGLVGPAQPQRALAGLVAREEEELELPGADVRSARAGVGGPGPPP